MWGSAAHDLGCWLKPSCFRACCCSPGQALYSAAKAGLNGYFAALATEVCDRWASIQCQISIFWLVREADRAMVDHLC